MGIDMMEIVLVCLVALLTTGYSRRVPVTRHVCGSKYELDEGDEIEFVYSGADLQTSTCKLELERDRSIFGHEICAKIIKGDALCSGMTVEYHKTIYTSYPDKELTCMSAYQNEEFCANFDLIVALKPTSSSYTSGSQLQIKAYLKEDEFSSSIPQIVKTTSYIVIGVVVGCIVLMIVIVVVIIICCCRRRSSASGTVYRSPQMAAVTTTTHASYPAQQQPYQPYAGYQPPPQTGYQPGPYPQPAGYPPAQAGYPPASQPVGYPPAQQPAGYALTQQAGYPPAPQQGYAGYQASSAPVSQEAAPTSEKPPIATAPPMSEVYPMQQMAPPPYPGRKAL